MRRKRHGHGCHEDEACHLLGPVEGHPQRERAGPGMTEQDGRPGAESVEGLSQRPPLEGR
ncbi:hypothetical protein ACUXK4_001016 [Methylorubrum extorquens]